MYAVIQGRACNTVIEAPQAGGQDWRASDSDADQQDDTDSENDPEKDCRGRALCARRGKGGKAVTIAPAADAAKALKRAPAGSVRARTPKRVLEPEDTGTPSASRRVKGDGDEPLARGNSGASSQTKAPMGLREVVSTMADGRAERVKKGVEAGAARPGCIACRHALPTCL